MKNSFIILLFLFFFSCNIVKKDYNNLSGSFYKRVHKQGGFGYLYSLELNKDHSFFLSIKTFEANPRCRGLWEVYDDKLVLKCDEIENVLQKLTNGYLSKRKNEITIINFRKLEFENVVLRRIK